jgi:hypothetical protein
MQKININFVLLLASLTAFLLGLAFWSQPPFDPDLGWHLFGGAFVATHHQVPTADLINSFSPRWHDYHWLAQWGMFLVYESFGYQGLSVLLGILSASFALLLVAIAKRMQLLRRSPLLVLIAVILALFLMARVTSVRPQVISLFMLGLTLFLLKGKSTWSQDLIFICLAVLGANVHVYWIFIPILYAIYRILPALLDRQRSRFYQRMAFLLLLSFAALISPYGLFHDRDGWLWENYALLFDYLVMPDAVSSTIGELQSAFTSGTSAALLICLYLMIMARGFRKKDLATALPDLLSAALGLVLAIKATKFLAIFALLSFPYFLITLVRISRPFRISILAPGKALSSLLLLAFCLLTLVRTLYLFPRAADLEQQLAENLPIQACEKIALLPLEPTAPRQHVRVLTHFNYGGWCRWIIYNKAPERDLRVTIDGRTQWFPPEFFTKGIDLYNARFGWLETLKRWDPDVLLVSRDKPLASVLGLAKGNWRLEHEDASFVVFTPVRVVSSGLVVTEESVGTPDLQ